ncbi:CAP domain-containing protein [Streptomyces sp. NPDC126514]|uniref:CAP domain-containing protein n=1 Tax=Streptomyces sp. NPDC126514 TaxID=3155210 RepID=UPI0033230D1E
MRIPLIALTTALAALVTTAAPAAPVAAVAPEPGVARSPGPGPEQSDPPGWKPAAVPAWHAPAPFRPAVVSPGRSASPAAPRPGDGDVISRVNVQRSRAGCPALRAHPLLGKAARAHSADMARTGRLSHEGSDGSTSAERLAATGYRFGEAGEVITTGVGDEAGAVRSWMGSGPHRRLLLTCSFRHAGTGVARGGGDAWWTVVLAAPE